MAYSAFKSFDENKIDKQVRAGKHSLIVDYDLESIPSDYIKPLKSAILVTYNNTGSDVRINPILEAGSPFRFRRVVESECFTSETREFR